MWLNHFLKLDLGIGLGGTYLFFASKQVWNDADFKKNMQKLRNFSSKSKQIFLISKSHGLVPAMKATDLHHIHVHVSVTTIQSPSSCSSGYSKIRGHVCVNIITERIHSYLYFVTSVHMIINLSFIFERYTHIWFSLNISLELNEIIQSTFGYPFAEMF